MKLNEYITRGGEFGKKATFVITAISRVITKQAKGMMLLLRVSSEKESTE